MTGRPAPSRQTRSLRYRQNGDIALWSSLVVEELAQHPPPVGSPLAAFLAGHNTPDAVAAFAWFLVDKVAMPQDLRLVAEVTERLTRGVGSRP